MGWSTMAGWRRHMREAGVGVGLALVYGLLLYVFGQSGPQNDGPAYYVLLIIIPFVAPMIAVRFIDPDGRQSSGRHALTGIGVGLLMLLCGVVLLKEGGVCTVIGAPFYLVLGPVGAVIYGSGRRGRTQRRDESVKLRSVAVLALLPLAAQLLQRLPAPIADKLVTSTTIIAAPPPAVWAQLVEVRNIRADELDWTFSQDVAGVPKPTDARLDRRGVGGVRHVRWGAGVAFEEVVTRWRPDRELAWRFAFPSGGFGRAFDEHIDPDSATLRVADGSYRLDPLPSGRTLLTLTTHYRVGTPINDYCALWGRVFVGDFHANVLRVIKGRAETS